MTQQHEEVMKDRALEPRVAKLETGLERLTEDVRDLAGVVRSQGSNIEGEIQKLMIAVTQAAGPRKTDWSTLISAIFLIMAIGSAVFWPLNQTSQNNKTELQTLTQKFEEHGRLELHPVGKALLGRVEDQLKTHIDNNREEFKQHEEMDTREFQNLDKKLQTEFALANDALKQKVYDLEKEITLVNEKMCSRVTSIESRMTRQDTLDLEELRSWRNKASGLSSPSGTVPLISKEIPGK